MKIILVHQETSKQKGGLHYLYAFKWPLFQYTSNSMRKPTTWSKCLICTFLFKNCFHVLRVYQTLIIWIQSLSAILPLFWSHDIANFLTFAAKTCEMLLWRHEIHNIFPRNRINALQNLLYFHYFTTKFNIFSLNLTWNSDFLILFIGTQNKLSMTGF